ncbi:calaxin-like [Babylonia areolata]|uniref:calaxin-like n=1 Tax=Babylonia areolata TaxID=304850 RepID=UPI003FD54132
MASKRAQMDKKVAELVQKTKLSKAVIQNLVRQYEVLCSLDRGMEREKLQDTLMDKFGLLDAFLLDRIYRTFNASASAQHLKPDDYVIGMSNFLSSDLDSKMKFCFSVYDLNGDGLLSKDEMYQFLKNTMVTKSHDVDQDDGDDNVKELTEMVLKLLDTDRDGRVTFEDFKNAVNGNRLLLELLGQCLPDERGRCAYLRMLGEPSMGPQPVTMSSKNSKRA